MGKIQVGLKSPKTVDMGGITIVPDAVAEVKVNVDNAEVKAKLQEGHRDFADDDAGKDANGLDENKADAAADEVKADATATEAPANGDDSVKTEAPAERRTTKKNKNA